MPQYCFDEEFPVTLQVAFIATDGWLFASDTLETNRGPQSRTTRHTRKISYDRKSGLIWLVCGDLISRRAADDVAAAYAGGEFPDEYSFPTKLREIGNKRWDKEAENPARKEFPSFRASIYAFPGQSCFWGLEVAEESHSTAIGDKTVIGDRGNSAAFFSEQYYSPDATVTQLIPLAPLPSHGPPSTVSRSRWSRNRIFGERRDSRMATRIARTRTIPYPVKRVKFGDKSSTWL